MGEERGSCCVPARNATLRPLAAKSAFWELDRLKLRGRICNASIGFLTVTGVLIGATVMVMFLGEIVLPKSERIVPWTFLGAVGSFVLALRFGRDLPRPGIREQA